MESLIKKRPAVDKSEHSVTATVHETILKTTITVVGGACML